MRNFDGNIVVLDLLETYHESGEFSFKVVLNPRKFKNSHASWIEILDPEHLPMSFDVRKWGRKINCTFAIDGDVSNGVCLVKLHLVPDDGDCIDEVLSFWIIR